MTATPVLPTADLINAACKRFDQENEIVEGSLDLLFGSYPDNRNLKQVLLKVVALNRLYSTNVLAVFEMAEHIHGIGGEIDSELAKGTPEIVDRIARNTIKGKNFVFYSFATKYCSWHNKQSYPIYDSRVDKYLCSLKRHRPFESIAFKRQQDLWHYPTFVQIMKEFRSHFGLDSFSFKSIDKFVWSEGEKLVSSDGGKQEVTPVHGSILELTAMPEVAEIDLDSFLPRRSP